MRTHFSILLAIGSMLALGNPAPAQPAPKPDYGAPISNEQARTAAGAALAEAKKNNWRMAISVVGPAGELVYFEKMDGVQLASIEISQEKARTAVRFRVPSKVFADQYAAGNLVFMTFPERPVASEGGIPIVVSDKIIGAIGVSGGTGQQDGTAANAGATAVK